MISWWFFCHGIMKLWTWFFLLTQPVYPLVQCPLLLYLAYLLLEGCGSHLHSNNTPLSLKLHRWKLRCLCLQQRLLSQRSASLWEELSRVIESIKTGMAAMQLSEWVRHTVLAINLSSSYVDPVLLLSLCTRGTDIIPVTVRHTQQSPSVVLVYMASRILVSF